ncbi:hatching enzyme 1.2-like [Toxorhynchites rutilus septentrionalis]|uniref:hatching enzyme 1.2-like n=1 Tax=Toxorhynchites rutilus septentrionalis TaxID=329112 RepID=UPI002478BE38|nr:hatching enzyme 1.2-like [Toxorhynchites rutilus septentrionalis]
MKQLFILVLFPIFSKTFAQLEEYEFDLSHLDEDLYNPRNGNHTDLGHLFGYSNPEELGNFAEGDIYQPLLVKNAVKFKSRTWKKAVVPYEISDDFSYNEVLKIRNAFKLFRQKSCVRFVPRVNQPDFISIQNAPNGCWSAIGRTGGKQILNLQSGVCLRQTGTILHEIMHALGFFHEHNRYDRERFVKINAQNIRPDATKNFRKDRQKESTTNGVGYDLGSVMHYSLMAFSRNGKPTIEPKVKFSGAIGQRVGFSSKDVQKINSLLCKDY